MPTSRASSTVSRRRPPSPPRPIPDEAACQDGAIATTIEEHVAPFHLPSPKRPLAPPLMHLTDASIGYGDDAPILRDLNLTLDIDDRIGLLGVNGAGKSTFAKMAAGALQVRDGRMVREGRVQVGWFHQHQIEAMDPKDTPLAIIRREASRRQRIGPPGQARELRAPLRQAGKRRWTPCRAVSGHACSSTSWRCRRPTCSSSTSRRTTSTSTAAARSSTPSTITAAL